jgi:hypothetical protein
MPTITLADMFGIVLDVLLVVFSTLVKLLHLRCALQALFPESIVLVVAEARDRLLGCDEPTELISATPLPTHCPATKRRGGVVRMDLPAALQAALSQHHHLGAGPVDWSLSVPCISVDGCTSTISYLTGVVAGSNTPTIVARGCEIPCDDATTESTTPASSFVTVATSQRFIVKLTSMDPAHALILRFGRMLHEVYFYADVTTFAPPRIVRTPACYFAETFGGVDATLVLEDLSNMQRVDPTREVACLVTVKRLLTILARLHSHGWRNEAAVTKHPWLEFRTTKFARHLGLHLFKKASRRFVRAMLKDAAGDALPPAVGDAIAWVSTGDATRAFAAGLDHLNGSPYWTLIHGDFRLANTLLPTADEQQTQGSQQQPVVLDWQAFGKGHPAVDLNYFLVMDLTVDQRREHEIDLLQHYYAALDERVQREMAFEDLCRDYRACTLVKSFFHNMVAATELTLDPHAAAVWTGRRAAALLDHDFGGAITQQTNVPAPTSVYAPAADCMHCTVCTLPMRD